MPADLGAALGEILKASTSTEYEMKERATQRADLIGPSETHVEFRSRSIFFTDSAVGHGDRSPSLSGSKSSGMVASCQVPSYYSNAPISPPRGRGRPIS